MQYLFIIIFRNDSVGPPAGSGAFSRRKLPSGLLLVLPNPRKRKETLSEAFFETTFFWEGCGENAFLRRGKWMGEGGGKCSLSSVCGQSGRCLCQRATAVDGLARPKPRILKWRGL